MTGYQYITLLSIAAVVSIYLAFLSFQKKQAPGARSLVVLMIGIALWTLGQACQMLSSSFLFKMLFHDFMYIGIILTPPNLFMFIIERHMLPYFQSLKRRFLLYTFPLLSLIILFTNAYHGFFYTSVTILSAPPFTTIHRTFNSWFWVHTAYSYMLILASFIITLYQLHSQSRRYHKQTILLLVSIALPVVMNLLYLTLNNQNTHLDMTPIALLITGLLFFLSISAFHLFDFSPITKQLIYENVADMILVLDLNNRIIDYNHAFSTLVNQSENNITGRHIASFYKEAGLSDEEIEKIIQGASTFKIEKDHQIKYFRIQESSILKKNDPIAKLYLFQDITDIEMHLIRLEEASARLRQSTAAKSRYLSDLSHEIRTPIHGILGMSHQLLENHEQQEFEVSAQKIHNSAHRILNTVNTILDYSKLEAQKLHFLEEVFSLLHFKDSFESEMKHFKVDLQLPEFLDLSTSYFYGDLKHTIQILALFIKETASFVEDPSYLVNASFIKPGDMTFTIICSCSKIQAEKCKEIFEQSEEHLTKVSSLNPISYALCQKLIIFCKGNYVIEAVNEGLKFTCSLPFTPASKEENHTDIHFQEIIKQPFVIAVVDDSIINQRVLQNQLKETAFKIECFNSGRDALRALESKTFHLILTDLNMPEFSGYDLAHAIYKKGFEKLPIIAISANEKTEIELNQASLFKDFILKPFKKKELLQIIVKALNETTRF